MSAVELNFDGLVGPTHNYSGLALGNLASVRNRERVSSPRSAALQGLAKMKRLYDLGLPQGVLPPHPRPEPELLRRLGFSGGDEQVLASAARRAPWLLCACSSASAMWTANAATVSPAADTRDGRVHFTPANLVSQLHRSIEAGMTSRILRTLFHHPQFFCVHDPLPATAALGDEGGANHSRLCMAHSDPGVALFVYGRSRQRPGPQRFPARQTLEASEAVARQHGLDPARVIYLQQQPAAIDAGVFHNDLIALANRNLLFCHEEAFVDQPRQLERLDRALDGELHLIQVSRREVTLQAAVESYLFNSQLLSLPDGRNLLLVPEECRKNDAVWHYLQRLLQAGKGIDAVEVTDLRQSMRNGGGPACLRLRVVLEQKALAACHQGVLFSERLHAQLTHWVERHYRDRLLPSELADPALLDESRRALDELTELLGLGGLYPFQR
jgi:succinylarginine dihydrolase (EC 3.-.-.-)